MSSPTLALRDSSTMLRRNLLHARRYPSLTLNLLLTPVVLLLLFVYIFGGAMGAGTLTFGTLVAFFEYSNRFFVPIRDLSAKYSVMQATMASSERIFALLDTPASIATPARPVPFPEGRGDYGSHALRAPNYFFTLIGHTQNRIGHLRIKPHTRETWRTAPRLP